MGGSITLGLRTLDGKVGWYGTWTNSLTWLIYHRDFLTQTGEEWREFKKHTKRLSGPQATEYGYLLLDTIQNVQYSDNHYSDYEELRAWMVSTAWMAEFASVYQHLLEGNARDIVSHNFGGRSFSLPFIKKAATKFHARTSVKELRTYLDEMFAKEKITFDPGAHKFQLRGKDVSEAKLRTIFQKRKLDVICIGYNREYLRVHGLYSHPTNLYGVV